MNSRSINTFLPGLLLILLSNQVAACSLDKWSLSSGESVIASTQLARYEGQCGLRVNLSSVGNGWVGDTTPGELPYEVSEYWARFYLYIEEVSIESNETLTVFAGEDADNRPLFGLEIVSSAGSPAFQLYAMNDDGSRKSFSGTMPAEPGWRAIHLSWFAGASSGGWVSLGMDDSESLQTVDNLDNGSHVLNQVRLGAVAGNNAGIKGVMDIDNFSSRRTGSNGLVNKSCSGLDVQLDNTTFIPGLYSCNATLDFTLGQRVTIDRGAKVEIISNITELLPGVSVQNGAVLAIK